MNREIKTDVAMEIPTPTKRVMMRPFRVFDNKGNPYRNNRRFPSALEAAKWAEENGATGFIQDQVHGVKYNIDGSDGVDPN